MLVIVWTYEQIIVWLDFQELENNQSRFPRANGCMEEVKSYGSFLDLIMLEKKTIIMKGIWKGYLLTYLLLKNWLSYPGTFSFVTNNDTLT